MEGAFCWFVLSRAVRFSCEVRARIKLKGRCGVLHLNTEYGRMGVMKYLCMQIPPFPKLKKGNLLTTVFCYVGPEQADELGRIKLIEGLMKLKGSFTLH